MQSMVILSPWKLSNDCSILFIRPTERGGGSRGKCPGGPKGGTEGPLKNKACVKRGESEAEMGRLKTVHQAQHNASSLFF